LPQTFAGGELGHESAGTDDAVVDGAGALVAGAVVVAVVGGDVVALSQLASTRVLRSVPTPTPARTRRDLHPAPDRESTDVRSPETQRCHQLINGLTLAPSNLSSRSTLPILPHQYRTSVAVL
jgi:hypothetical protein